MNGYPADFKRKTWRYTCFACTSKDVKKSSKLRNLRDRFRKEKKKNVVKVRYVQLKMRYRRIVNLVSILGRNTEVYWPAIFHSIKQSDCTSPSFDFVSDCAITFLDKLMDIGCRDAKTVEKILKLYGFYCASKHGYLKDEEMSLAFYSDIQSIFHSDSICNCGFNDNVTYFDEDLLQFAMRANDLKFMKALLKYGINVPDSSKLCRTVVELAEFWARWLKPFDVPLIQGHEGWIHICKTISGKERGYRRFFLITKMLRIMDIKWCREKPDKDRDLDKYPVYTDKQVYDCVQSMKLYFRTTVEPLISKDDIVKFISFQSIWYYVPEDFLKRAAQEYKNLFPEQSNAPYCPRTLQHLSRYNLRKSLTEKKVGVLPELVENLFFPDPLKSYLRCEY